MLEGGIGGAVGVVSGELDTGGVIAQGADTVQLSLASKLGRLSIVDSCFGDLILGRCCFLRLPGEIAHCAGCLTTCICFILKIAGGCSNSGAQFLMGNLGRM